MNFEAEFLASSNTSFKMKDKAEESTSTSTSTSASASASSPPVGMKSSLKKRPASTTVESSSPPPSNDTNAPSSLAAPESKKTKRWPLHVEAIVHPCSPVSFDTLGAQVEEFVKSVGQTSFMYKEGAMDLTKASLMIRNSCLEVNIVDIPSPTTTHQEIQIGDDDNNNDAKNITSTDEDRKPFVKNINIIQTNSSIASWSISNIIVHCYILSTAPAEPEEIDEMNDEPITACEVLPLPHQSLHTSWENLIYPREIKENIIGYAESALLFANKGVSNHIIAWNRVLLLHGPPGTGKTSLCRALSHKLTIRTNHIFPSGGYLLEIKSHSLFSKWFSESGKLVSKLFERIREMVEDEPNSLFCVLIDEVESLASSRVGGAGGSSEPSDAVRAVNSVLTSLDSIRGYRNVMILTTTNITDSIDAAFVDRVDLKQYVGYPCLEARYEILKSCLQELIRVGIISKPVHGLQSFSFAINAAEDQQEKDSKMRKDFDEILLLQCAKAAKDLSGRSLRKIPFQSHAFFVRSSDTVSLTKFLMSLKHGIDKERRSRNDLSGGAK